MQTAKKTPLATVLVTGATSGIGQAIARGFANTGKQVLAVGVGTLPPDEENLSYAELDVQDETAIATMIEPLGDLSVVVNAAGIIQRGAEHDPAVFHHQDSIVVIRCTQTYRSFESEKVGAAVESNRTSRFFIRDSLLTHALTHSMRCD